MLPVIGSKVTVDLSFSMPVSSAIVLLLPTPKGKVIIVCILAEDLTADSAMESLANWILKDPPSPKTQHVT